MIGGSLLVIPIGRAWDIPESKMIILPLLGSGLGAAVLFERVLASWEFAFGLEDNNSKETVGRPC